MGDAALTSPSKISKSQINLTNKPDSFKFKTILLEGLSGGLSGLFAYSTTFPLDVIQTRLQSTVDHERIKNLKPIEFKSKYVPNFNLRVKNKYFAIGKDICVKDGWRGFFKVCFGVFVFVILLQGYLPLIVGIFPSRFTYFGVNTQTRKIFDSTYGEHNHETFKIAFSAIMGSVTASTITSPIWVTKTHLQLKRYFII